MNDFSFGEFLLAVFLGFMLAVVFSFTVIFPLRENDIKKDAAKAGVLTQVCNPATGEFESHWLGGGTNLVKCSTFR